jgi:hypothetical protein
MLFRGDAVPGSTVAEHAHHCRRTCPTISSEVTDVMNGCKCCMGTALDAVDVGISLHTEAFIRSRNLTDKHSNDNGICMYRGFKGLSQWRSDGCG